MLALLLAGFDVEGRDAVEGVRMILGGGVALALLGHHMDQQRLVVVLRPKQHPGQLLDVVAVHRANVLEAQGVEELVVDEQGAHAIAALLQKVKHRVGRLPPGGQAGAHALLHG